MGFTPRSNHSYHGSTYYVGFYPEDLIYFTYKGAIPSGELPSGCTDTSAQCSSYLIESFVSSSHVQISFNHTNTSFITYIRTYIQSHIYTYIHIHMQHTNNIIHTYSIDHHVPCFIHHKKSHPQCIWSRDVSIKSHITKKESSPVS